MPVIGLLRLRLRCQRSFQAGLGHFQRLILLHGIKPCQNLSGGDPVSFFDQHIGDAPALTKAQLDRIQRLDGAREFKLQAQRLQRRLGNLYPDRLVVCMKRASTEQSQTCCNNTKCHHVEYSPVKDF